MSDTSSFGPSGVLQAFWKAASFVPRLREFLTGPRALDAARWLLAVLVLGCVLTPRFPVGILSSFYRVDVRLDDLCLLAVFLAGMGWLVKSAVLREAAISEKAFLIFLMACQISILSGLFYRTIDKPLVSLFYVLKWAEYFLVFAVTWRIAFWTPDRRFLIGVFFALGLLLAAYGYWEHFFPAGPSVYPNYYRLFERAPFHGDANHVGGLLVLWMGVFTGFFLKSKTRGGAAAWLAALAFAFFPLVWTYSRKSYFAFAGALFLAFLIPVSRRRALLLAALFIVLGLALPTRLGERLADLGDAFSSSDPFHSSWAGNLSMWQSSLWNFNKFFIFGSGLGSRHRLYYESQYVLVLAETGLVGLAAFLAALFTPAWQIFKALIADSSGTGGALRLGWLIGFAGLLIHDASCVSLTVSKIAIPFWFLTAVVLAHGKTQNS